MLPFSLLTVASAADPDWHQLYAPRATATSFLRSNYNRFDENYHPNFAFDDDPATAWVEGVDGDGVGQVLSWDVSALSSARAVKLRVRNGYQKSAGLLAANGAPTRVEVSAWKGREVVAKQEYTLTATEGWQDLVLATDGRGLSHLELKVMDVRSGSKYADTCISDIQTFVDSDLPYDAAWERSRRAELTTWIAGRLEAAKSATHEGWPFASASWTRTEKPTTAAEVEAQAAPLRTLAPAIAALPAQRPTAKQPVLPDGLEFLAWDGIAMFLRGSELTVFESTDGLARRVVEECDGDCWEEWRDLRVKKAADGRTPVLATLTHATHQDGRMLYTANEQLVLTWDEAGHLVGVLEEGKAHEEALDDAELLVTEVTHLSWKDGRIVEVTRHVHRRPEKPQGEDWTELTVERWTPASG